MSLPAMITAILSEMGKTPAAMSRDEKMEVVKRLEERGAFLVKRSAEQVAEALDLSRFTRSSATSRRSAATTGRRDAEERLPRRTPVSAAPVTLFDLVRDERRPFGRRHRSGQERRQDDGRQCAHGHTYRCVSGSRRWALTANAPTTSPAAPSRASRRRAGTLIATTEGSLARSAYDDADARAPAVPHLSWTTS